MLLTHFGLGFFHLSSDAAAQPLPGMEQWVGPDCSQWLKLDLSLVPCQEAQQMRQEGGEQEEGSQVLQAKEPGLLSACLLLVGKKHEGHLSWPWEPWLPAWHSGQRRRRAADSNYFGRCAQEDS